MHARPKGTADDDQHHLQHPAPHRDDQHQELRHHLLLLLTTILAALIVGAAVYLAYRHPTLAEPLGVGGTTATALAAVIALTVRRQ